MQTISLTLLINVLFLVSTVKSQITSGYCTSRPNPCRNGGACVSVVGGGFTCTCAAGFTGNLCEASTGTSNVCTATTCLNGGTCIPTSTSTSVCNCPTGFAGVRCETYQGGTGATCPVGSNPCRNNAPCILLAGGGLRCVCLAGFTGLLCESGTGGTYPSAVCQTNRCSNGATCEAVLGGGYRCICPPYFTGVLCEIPTGGITVRTTAATASSTACRTNPCNNGGTCVTVPGGGYYCICNPAYTGFLCTYPITG